MWNDTVIEAVRAAAGPVLDLRRSASASTRIRRRRSAGDDRPADPRAEVLPLEQRTEKADRIAEIVRTALPDDLMMRAQDVHRLHEKA